MIRQLWLVNSRYWRLYGFLRIFRLLANILI